MPKFKVHVVLKEKLPSTNTNCYHDYNIETDGIPAEMNQYGDLLVYAYESRMICFKSRSIIWYSIEHVEEF